LKDLYVWKTKSEERPTFNPGEYGEDGVWKEVKATVWEDASCVAFVETAGTTTCDEWCDYQGLECVRGIDDANHGKQYNPIPDWLKENGAEVSSCLVNEPADEMKKGRENMEGYEHLQGYAKSKGCSHPLNTQICACTQKTSLVQTGVVSDHRLGFEEDRSANGAQQPEAGKKRKGRKNGKKTGKKAGEKTEEKAKQASGCTDESDKLLEDCTLKDLYVWKTKSEERPTFNPGEYGEDGVWKEVKATVWEDASCVAFVETAGTTTCDEWCDYQGLECVRGIDDANHGKQYNPIPDWLKENGAEVSSCLVNEPADERKKGLENTEGYEHLRGYAQSKGCNHPLKTQICACTQKTSLVQMPVGLWLDKWQVGDGPCRTDPDMTEGGKGDYEKFFRIDTLSACQVLCDRNSACKAMEYRGTTCELHKVNATHVDPKIGTQCWWKPDPWPLMSKVGGGPCRTDPDMTEGGKGDYEVHKTETLTLCQALCDSNSACKAIEYRGTRCELHKVNATHVDPKMGTECWWKPETR